VRRRKRRRYGKSDTVRSKLEERWIDSVVHHTETIGIVALSIKLEACSRAGGRVHGLHNRGARREELG
jgi:hypothetical protein